MCQLDDTRVVETNIPKRSDVFVGDRRGVVIDQERVIEDRPKSILLDNFPAVPKERLDVLRIEAEAVGQYRAERTRTVAAVVCLRDSDADCCTSGIENSPSCQSVTVAWSLAFRYSGKLSSAR